MKPVVTEMAAVAALEWNVRKDVEEILNRASERIRRANHIYIEAVERAVRKVNTLLELSRNNGGKKRFGTSR